MTRGLPNTDTLPWSGTAAGGGYSTVGDFFRFADALQSGKLMSKASLTQMITPGINRSVRVRHVTQPARVRRASFGHSGGAPGQNGDLRVFPESGYVIVALSNLDPPAASRMVDFIAARLPLASATTAPRSAIVVDDFESGTLCGMDAGSPGRWQLVHVSGRPPGSRSKTEQYVRAVQHARPATRQVCRGERWHGPGIEADVSRHQAGRPDDAGTDRVLRQRHRRAEWLQQSRSRRRGTLAINAGPNQQFRIDILAPTAAADSMADADLRATVFETGPDAPARRGPTPVRYDLSPWAGQTVRLRIATADNQAPMRAGIDNVRLIPIDR